MSANLIEIERELRAQAEKGKRASKQLGLLSSEEKNRLLQHLAEELVQHQQEILAANQLDLIAARQSGMTEAKIDRLMLNEKRIREMADGLLALCQLKDPVGEILDEWTLENQLLLQKVRVPFGLVVVIYESRPNVTVDAAGISLKTGNAILLRGGREAFETNNILVKIMQDGIESQGLPRETVSLVQCLEREAIDLLIRLKGIVDLVVPRGGAGLIERVVNGSQVPVIETGVGNCHVFVDEHADLKMAKNIIQNAKLQRPSVCNAAETLLLHQSVSKIWVESLISELEEQGVEIRACERTRSIIPSLKPASESDWYEEYSDLILAVKLVDDVTDALQHIEKYGTKHSETIVTSNQQNADQFLKAVDAAVVYHNASTRFTDGGQFGFGAEIGISTQKMHARGPMGLPEMTTYKYVGRGNGQVRK